MYAPPPHTLVLPLACIRTPACARTNTRKHASALADPLFRTHTYTNTRAIRSRLASPHSVTLVCMCVCQRATARARIPLCMCVWCV